VSRLRIGRLAVLISTAGLGVVVAGQAAVIGPPVVGPRDNVPVAAKGSVSGRIAYESYRGGIWIMGASGSHRRRVTRTPPATDFNPKWSPSGRQLVFRTRRGHHLPDPMGIGVDGIFVIDVTGRNEHPVQPPSGGLFPDWSPDGKLIVMSGVRNAVETLFTVRPSGKGLHDLGVSGEGAEWSPDGRRLVYGWHPPGEEWAVWVAGADGNDPHPLTHPSVDPAAPLGTAGDAGALWSPDGRQILFSRGAGAARDLWIMNADGSNQHSILSWKGADSPNAWLRGGRVVFAHYAPGASRPRWFVVDVDGRRLQSLAWLDGVAADPLDWLPSR
jgi:Tol biopolymer transport system component